MTASPDVNVTSRSEPAAVLVAGSTSSCGRRTALLAVFARPALRRVQVSTAGSFAGDAIAAVAFGVLAYRAAGPEASRFSLRFADDPRGVGDAARHSRGRPAAAGAASARDPTSAASSSRSRRARSRRPGSRALRFYRLRPGSRQRRPRRTLCAERSSRCSSAARVSSPQPGSPRALLRQWHRRQARARCRPLLPHEPGRVVLLAAVGCFAVSAFADRGLPSTDEVRNPGPAPVGHRPLLSAYAFAAIRAQPELRIANRPCSRSSTGRGSAQRPRRGRLTPTPARGKLRRRLADRRRRRRRGARRHRRSRPRRQAATRNAAGLRPRSLGGGVPRDCDRATADRRNRPRSPFSGLATSLADVAGHTLIGRAARDDVLARVYGVVEAIRSLAITVGAGATALVAALAGANALLLAAGGMLAAGALAGLLRRQAETVAPPAEYLEIIRSNALFGWLAPVALERVASNARSARAWRWCSPDVRRKVGDRAYLVADGELVAERAGREVGRIGRGGVVGEIALLQDTPRTATVRALTATRVLGIGRDEFLAAATGSDAACAASDDLVERRLASHTEAQLPRP